VFFRISSFPLPGGVMVAQTTLTRFVMVRLHAGQPMKVQDSNGVEQDRVPSHFRFQKIGPFLMAWIAKLILPETCDKVS
jgi:hypothetical protein